MADLQRKRLDAGMPNGRVLRFNGVVIRKGDQQQLVSNWFQQRGRLLANEYLAKWYLIRDALVRNRTDGALVRLTTRLRAEQEPGSADERLTQFALRIVSGLDGYVPL